MSQVMRKLLHRCRILIDVFASILLLVLLSIWGTRYLLAGEPVVGQIELFFGTDKNMHLLLGFCLPLCVAWLSRVYRWHLHSQVGYFALVAISYAGDEWFQSTLSYRAASLEDFLMSITGLAIAMSVWYTLLGLTRMSFRNDLN